VSRKKRQQPNPQQQSIDSVDDIEGKLQQAISFYQVGQLQQAEQICQQILRNFPKQAETLHLLGIIAHQVGDYRIATSLITQAIEIDPNQSSFFYNVGNALREQGKLDESVEAYQQAIHIQPDHADAYNNLGNVLKEQGKLDESVEAYQQAIEHQPQFSGAHNNLGVALQEQGRLEESIEVYQKAIEIQPDHADAYYNVGNALRKQGRLEESIEVYQKAIEIQPDHADAYNNLGNVLKEQGKLDESIDTYQQAIEIQPDHADAHKNLGIILLLKGNLSQGWKEYGWRWKCDDIISKNRDFPQPSWDGTNLNGKSILVWAEQGIGDEIMFTSILPTLSQMTEKTIIECNLRLVPLFQRSFPQIQFFSRQNLPHPHLLDENIDYQIPMGGLGRWLRTDEDSFERSKQSYLTACTNRSARIRKRYQKLAGGRILVGISWKSTGINQKRALLKSTVLEDWKSILSQQDCYFINLQYGDVKEELTQLQQQTDLIIYQDEKIDSLRNLDDFAAQVSALDLVISTSNTTVHVAGALGKPVWTLLSYVPDWRWMLEREDTPWYPSMRLFRQSETGDWPGIFAQVNSALEQLCIR
jgi:Tfp pilus assembly protein PilF